MFSFVELRLVKPKTEDLSPNVCAITLIERKENEEPRIAGVRLIAFTEMVAEIRPPSRVKIHREKRDFARDITAAKSFVEFNAVENADAVGDADALAANIAMTVADSSILDAAFE